MKNMFNPSAYQKLSNIALLLVVAMFYLSCGPKPKVEPPPTLPPVSTAGLNTFGAYVDDVLWLPSNKPSFTNRNLCVGYSSGVLIFTLYCNRDASGNQGDNFFYFYRNGINGNGDYDLSDPKSSSIKTNTENIDNASDYFKVLSGKLTILELDTIHKIVSGQFEVVVQNVTKNLIYTVKSGRFDFQIDYCH